VGVACNDCWQKLLVIFHAVAQEIAELPFTPGHEMVGKVDPSPLVSSSRRVCGDKNLSFDEHSLNCG
jgi:D-arabinose 1-dehydrogenase-like Zn-dependent alcohol dehydrogenase